MLNPEPRQEARFDACLFGRDSRRLQRRAFQALHGMVEAEIVKIVPGGGERGADQTDNADIFHGHVKYECTQRHDQQKADDFEAESVADTIGQGTQFILRYVTGPSRMLSP